MDASQLRLILLVLGIALVAGIYFWDRLKTHRLNSRKASRKPRRQPSLHQTETEDAVDESLLEEPLYLTPLDEINTEALDAEEMEFSAFGKTDYLHANPAEMDSLPTLVLQINLISKDAPIKGGTLLKATQETQMRLGQMGIFHRYDDRRSDHVLFSMANQHEPGSFPVDDMSDFETTGLTLFTQLPGLRDGMMIYSDMLFTAERLAALMGAELQDETHSILTKQAIEHTREQILEHKRRLELQRRRG